MGTKLKAEGEMTGGLMMPAVKPPASAPFPEGPLSVLTPGVDESEKDKIYVPATGGRRLQGVTLPVHCWLKDVRRDVAPVAASPDDSV